MMGKEVYDEAAVDGEAMILAPSNRRAYLIKAAIGLLWIEENMQYSDFSEDKTWGMQVPMKLEFGYRVISTCI